LDDEIARVVRKHGWFAANVSDNEPPFLYSIGLMQTADHPEFIVFGLEPDNAHALISGLIWDIKVGGRFDQPGIYTIVLGEEYRIGIRRVHPTQHPLYLGFAMGYCRHLGRIGELEAVQAFWPDSSGKFPFEVGCDPGVSHYQPRLDIPLTPREIRESERRWE
jgi:hypothetical protein